MDLPPCSLILIQSGRQPATFRSRRVKQNKVLLQHKSTKYVSNKSDAETLNCLPPKALDSLLLHIPEVNVLPCGVSAMLNIKAVPSNLNSTSHVLFLIDMDEKDSPCLVCSQNGSHKMCLRGSELLTHLSTTFNSQDVRNVVPIVMASSWSTESINQSLNHGAIDYLTKPLSSKVARLLWINVFRFRASKNPSIPKSLPSFNLASTTLFNKPVLSFDSNLENVIVDYYTPKSTKNLNFDYQRFNFPTWRVNQLIRRTRHRMFYPHHFTENELLVVCQLIFEDAGKCLNIPIVSGQLKKFILVARASYLNNEYHNFHHAVDVLQAVYVFLLKMGLRNYSKCNESSIRHIPPSYILTLLIAALGHDVGHPGVNNAFLIKTGIPIVSLYNNIAILENFHALALINLIHQHDCLFFDGYFDDITEFHNLLSTIIIATDMGAHFEHVQRVKVLAQKFDGPHQPSEGDIITFLSALIKCADIVNVTRPFDIATKWTQHLTQEFLKQCNMEVALGVDPMMPPEQLQGSQNNSQVTFIQSMALPLFESAAALIPELNSFSEQLSENLEIWEMMCSVSTSCEPTLKKQPSSNSLSPQQGRITLVAGT